MSEFYHMCGQNQQAEWQRVIKHEEEQQPLAMDTSFIILRKIFQENKMKSVKA